MISRKGLFGRVTGVAALVFLGGMPKTAVASSAAAPRRIVLSPEQRALLRQASSLPQPRPTGLALEVAPGVVEYRGLVTFKMPYRVMSGKARSLVWRASETDPNVGCIHVDLMWSPGVNYPLRVVPDMSNTSMSRVVVEQ